VRAADKWDSAQFSGIFLSEFIFCKKLAADLPCGQDVTNEHGFLNLSVEICEIRGWLKLG